VAVKFLREQGYKIVSKNWRNKFCEIDIVARKKDVIYFVEVKFRRGDESGSGIEYITSTKLQQMAYAAENWVTSKKWRHGYQLAAIEVSGSEFLVTEFIENLY